MTKRSLLERVFESILWKSRLIVLVAVIASVFGAIGLFVLGAVEIFSTVKDILLTIGGEHYSYADAMIGVIGAVDLFLVGIVLLIFSFGIYELFVSRLDDAHEQKDLKILNINSLDELKSKVLQVIMVVLIVTFFKVILTMHFQTPLEILYFALSITAVSLGVFFLRKVKGEE